MKCDKNDLLLYAVTDRHWLEGRTLKEVVKESLDGGVTFVQLREKTLEDEKFLEEARELKELCKKYNVPFVINDNVDIAIAMDADGVSYETLKAICEAVSIPVIAIGGINEGNVSKLAGSGIVGVAVISAIYAAKDIKKATEDLKAETLRTVEAN